MNLRTLSDAELMAHVYSRGFNTPEEKELYERWCASVEYVDDVTARLDEATRDDRDVYCDRVG